MRATWIVLGVLVPALASAQGISPVGNTGAVDVNSMRAESPARIYDHRSGEGYRVADGRWDGREEFAKSIPHGYGPSQVRHAYGFDQLYNDGAGQIIGIVWAFHYPTAGADLQHFIRTFGLREMYGLPGQNACTVTAGPHLCFEIVYASGTQPSVDPTAHFEFAIDTQSAHAIAPGADILMVEAASNLFIDLLHGVDVAVSLGPSIVSMSWGVPEISLETLFDHHFSVTGMTFIASSGDLGHAHTYYPANSPFVLAVGGTSLFLDRKGRRTNPEIAWSGSGGGISSAELEPAYQSDYPIPYTGNFRATPDVAIVADPRTGVAVYDSTPVAGQKGWFVAGGTSVGAPMWAGLTALANELRSAGNLSSNDVVHRPQYEAAKGENYTENYTDILTGSNGSCGAVCTAGPGYDFVTGLGTPKAENLVPSLAGRGEN
jgi:subtilase family serine protease